MKSYLKVFLLALLISLVALEATPSKEDNLKSAIKFMEDLVSDERLALGTLSGEVKVELEGAVKNMEDKVTEIKAHYADCEKDATEIEKAIGDLEKKRDSLLALKKSLTTKQANLAKSSQSNGGTPKDIWRRKNNMYLSENAIIHSDIMVAFNSNVIKKVGNPKTFDATSYRSTNKWNGKTIIRIGNNENTDGNGIATTPPAGYDVIWIQCLNDRWETFNVFYTNSSNKREHLGKFACGYRSLNEISPDGGSPNSFWNLFAWLKIPIVRSGVEHVITSGLNSDTWISGIAFSKNPWGHAMNSAVAYHWAINGGDGTTWHTHNWNNDNLSYFPLHQKKTARVPVVQNGKCKILYIVEHNNNWTGTQHRGVSVNGKAIERFTTTFNNPFSVHFNHKYFDRYIATRIPDGVIRPNDRFIDVTIDLTQNNHHIHFREIGTHDCE